MTSPGHRPDFVLPRSESLKGFPAFLQQISKILNYSCTSQGQSKSGSMLRWYNFMLEFCWIFQILTFYCNEKLGIFSFLSLELNEKGWEEQQKTFKLNFEWTEPLWIWQTSDILMQFRFCGNFSVQQYFHICYNWCVSLFLCRALRGENKQLFSMQYCRPSASLLSCLDWRKYY